MRPIKFRAWDDKSKKMLPFKDVYLFNGSWSIWDKNEETQDDNFVIMQFTGLKDKNGRDIYEGDIVRLDLGKREEKLEGKRYCYSTVVFMENGWKISDLEDRDCALDDLQNYDDYGTNKVSDQEVIGNIYKKNKLFSFIDSKINPDYTK